jgi:two-component system, response regulator
MTHRSQTITVLFAEDDHDDCLMVGEAFQECIPGSNLAYVHDGFELLHYLRRQAGYVTFTDAPRPDLILLDLRLPRMNGFEALAEIKADPELRSIPVVVLTNTSTEQDIMRAYDLGAAGFIIKPETFAGMLDVVMAINHYWFEVVELTNTLRGKGVKNTISVAYTLE